MSRKDSGQSDAFKWTVVGLDLRDDGWYASITERDGEWFRFTPNTALSHQAVIDRLRRRGHVYEPVRKGGNS